MTPWLIEDPFRIGTFGLIAVTAFVSAWLLFRYELRRNPDRTAGMLPSTVANVTFLLAAVFGILGAKLAFIVFEAPEFKVEYLQFNMGLTWYGGLLAGSTAVIVWFRKNGLSIPVMADMLAPMLALGYGIGRIGCHLSGDGDFGVPCVPENIDDFLCVSYPDGLVPSPCWSDGVEHMICPTDAVDPFWFPVHPTPIYESITGIMLFSLLWFLRTRISPAGVLFGIYCVISGLLRFGIEFIRMPEMRPERIFGLRDAQLTALIQAVTGLSIIAAVAVRRRRVRDRPR